MGGTALSWKSQKQSTVAQSTVECEYIVACSVSKECVFLKQLLFELAYDIHITVYCDSTAAVAMIKNPVQQQKVKAFLVVYHYVRECHKEERLRYEHLSGYLQPADMFTKPLPWFYRRIVHPWEQVFFYVSPTTCHGQTHARHPTKSIYLP